jgi:imidazolonepropionase-like amidohydrolase
MIVMSQVIFRNARIFDGFSGDCAEGMSVWVADGLIREISVGALTGSGAQIIDAAGKTLMPGLIDAHVHAWLCESCFERE